MLAMKPHASQTQSIAAGHAKDPAQAQANTLNPLWARLALGIQPKLKVGAPDDPYEQEADAVAERVVRMPGPPATIQRKCTACEDEERKPIQTKREISQDAKTAPSAGLAVREAVREGSRLPNDVRAYFEPRFGYDFSRVRVHTDAGAADGARTVGARAYTIGRDIVFGAGEYAPASVKGKQLLAHELTHVAQQSCATPLRRNAAQQSVTDAHDIFLARQPQPGQQAEKEEDEPQPTVVAGTAVSKIVIDSRRGRVGFVVPAPKFVILGSIKTDLKPGKYTIKPDTKNHKWVFGAGQVKVGQRFDVELDGVDPWSLSYPAELPLLVGISAEKQGAMVAGQTDTDSEADFVRTWDEATSQFGDMPEDKTIDGFIDWIYEPSVTPGTGQFSNQVTLRYSDGSEEAIDISTIDETSTTDPDPAAQMRKTPGGRDLPAKINCKTTPNLCNMKKAILRTRELIRQQGDAELLAKEFETFPQVFSVLAQVGVMGANAKTFKVNGRPARGRGAGGGSKPVLPVTRIKPVNGVVNVGGGLEAGAENATNLNPIVPGTGGPTRSIPNHVKAGFEQIGEVFEEGSVDKIISNRLPTSTVNWSQAAEGAAKAMKPGGKVAMKVWQLGTEDAAMIKEAFEKAGFKNVKVVGQGSGTVIVATR